MSSYFFYGVADWKMIPLLLGATAVFYALGLWLRGEMRKGHARNASRITVLGVVIGVGVLLYFKYLGFFAESLGTLLRGIGLEVSWTTLHIVLPVGVSFFTFKLISYVIEVHREHIEPCKDFVEFGTYIAFFPTLLSGPIDRPNTFLPQLRGERQFDYRMAADGCKQILWGMFTKMCIADNLAPVTDAAWASYTAQSGSTLVAVALLYFVQLYADFDGYSNMAIGVGKLLGVKITRNFNHPMLARNMAEFWRRWHMSLTSWITDYVFMPLNIAFRNLGNTGICLACIINLVVIGLWHGANWTYGLFGLYHGLLFIPLVYTGAFGKNKKIKPTVHGFPKAMDILKMAGTFCLVSAGLVLFRAPSVHDAFSFLSGVCSASLLSVPSLNIAKTTWLFIVLLFVMEWVQRDREHPLDMNGSSAGLFKHAPVRYLVYIVLIGIIWFFQGAAMSFMYFEF